MAVTKKKERKKENTFPSAGRKHINCFRMPYTMARNGAPSLQIPCSIGTKNRAAYTDVRFGWDLQLDAFAALAMVWPGRIYVVLGKETSPQEGTEGVAARWERGNQ